MTSTLLRNGRIATLAGAAGRPEHGGTAGPVISELTVIDAVVSAPVERPDRVVDLGGALVTPAFVDTHVHATSAGLALAGLDLTGCGSLPELLRAVAGHAARHPDVAVLWGHGWDETRWPQRRPPTRAELDDTTGGRPAYLSRVDVHSAAVTTALAAGATGLAGYSPTGPLTRAAHHAVRRAALTAIPAAQRRGVQRAFLDHAASLGIGSLHECAGPDISGLDDLRDLLALAGPAIVPYWGEPAADAEQARFLLAASGAHGLAGDLFCDGAIGSRTAALHEPYADAPESTGHTYLTAEAIGAHVAACTVAGVQAGFHLIGDAATAAVVEGFAIAEREVGRAALARRRHRLEHLEMIDAGQAAALARWGVVASVQPGFDRCWGGSDGMYATRLGTGRAAAMNPFAMLAAAGVELAFGSDAPVTELGPWLAVEAAVRHRTPASALGPAAALAAHTVGGHRAAADPNPLAGTLAEGAPASYAVWDTDRLPDLDGGRPPRCLHTVVDGETIFGGES